MSDGLLWYIGLGDAASQREAVRRGIAYWTDQHQGAQPAQCVVHPENVEALLDMPDVDFIVGTTTLKNHVFFGDAT